MINYNALLKISYGLYIVSSGDKNNGNGFISNTVFQVTSEPVRFAISCNKNNYTNELINKTKHFSISVLHEKASKNTLATFGFKSGKDFDKLHGMDVKYAKSNVPIILNDSVAWLELKVIESMDMGTHCLYIGELLNAEVLESNESVMTYDFYHKNKKGKAPKNAPTYIDKKKLDTDQNLSEEAIYECTVCGHIYDDNMEDIKFENLPEDWVCPTCGVAKEDFIKTN